MTLKWDILPHYIVKISIYLCAFLFVYAAVSKLLDFETFETQLGQSPLLSAYARPVAIGVPLLELLIALGLVIPRFRLWALYGFYGMMVMFTTYIVIILNFSDFVPCSCGGVLENMDWTEHLIFNGVFVLLSVMSIWILSQHKRKTLLILGLLVLLSAAAIVILFVSSEKQIKFNNAFQRRFMPHALEEIGVYDIELNSYYIAGIDDKFIYLGNYTAPLTMTIFDISGGNLEEFQVQIDSMGLDYRSVKISVNPPNFYVGDGTVPIIFQGRISDWKAKLYSYEDAYFTQFVVVDSLHIGIATMSSVTKSTALGLLTKTIDSIVLKLNSKLLITHINGEFATDGMLLWNESNQQFVFTYFYQNSYEIANKNLTHEFTGRTIDTVSKPILDIAYYSKKDQYKLGRKTILVNKQTSTNNNYLYIHSDRLGKYEDGKVLSAAGIIDVYDFQDHYYEFSFYIFHQSGEKLNDFRIDKTLLVALVGDKLWLYRLKPKYFSQSSNEKYTAQYQEEGRIPVEESRP
ncbi:MAG: MauE/DoxX family redox-associated membrane protein [Gelidibacter sp.]